MDSDIKFSKAGITATIGWKALIIWAFKHWQWILTWIILLTHVVMTRAGQLAQDKKIHDLQSVVACMASEGCKKNEGSIK